jgi:hypothetical protein
VRVGSLRRGEWLWLEWRPVQFEDERFILMDFFAVRLTTLKSALRKREAACIRILHKFISSDVAELNLQVFGL